MRAQSDYSYSRDFQGLGGVPDWSFDAFWPQAMPAPFRRLQGVSAVKQFRLTESPENCSAHRGPGLALSALADEEAHGPLRAAAL